MQVHVSVNSSGQPNYKGCKIPIPSALDLDAWSRLLVSYHDNVIVQFLTFGWPIGAHQSVPHSSTLPKNHAGARLYPQDVDKYIQKEVSLGASLGPFAFNPMPGKAHLSPLNSVPKKDTDERRIIVDLSFPHGRSVNCHIHKHYYEGEYPKTSIPFC